MANVEVNATIQGDVVHKYTATSSALAIAEDTGALDQAMKFDSLTLLLDVGPTTSENFTVTLNSRNGAEYDTVLFSLDLSTAPVTSLVLDKSDIDMAFHSGDQIDIAWTNTDGRTHGLEWALVEAV